MEVKSNMPHCPLCKEVGEKVYSKSISLSVNFNGGKVC